MPFPGPGTLPAPNISGISTSRPIIRQGIAAYLGGTFNPQNELYQGGPLTSAGLGFVSVGYYKRINLADAFEQAVGTGFGAGLIVSFENDTEVSRDMAGVPQLDGSGDIIAGGWKFLTYNVLLDGYFISQMAYAQDAENNLDILIESIKQQMRYDRTLGGICMDAGMSRFGIRVAQGHPGIDENDRIGIWFTIRFETRVNMIG
jgi:hypothetical protein